MIIIINSAHLPPVHMQILLWVFHICYKPISPYTQRPYVCNNNLVPYHTRQPYSPYMVAYVKICTLNF